MLRLFPGRTLEELDAVDMARLYQALETRNIEAVEERRLKFISGALKSDDLDTSEWESIRANDRAAEGLWGG